MSACVPSGRLRSVRALLPVALAVVAFVVHGYHRIGSVPATCAPGTPAHDRVALVLSGGPDFRRTGHAVRLFGAGAVEHLVISGGGRVDPAPALAERAIGAGVPASAVTVEASARSTVENFRYSCRMPEIRNASEVAIVTERFHSYRAWLTARRQCPGVRFCSAPADLDFNNVMHRRELKKLLAYQLFDYATLW